jgi:hypothetical protein
MNFFRRCVTILAGYVAAATAGLIVPAGFIFIGIPDKITLSGVIAGIWEIASFILIIGGPLLVPALFVIGICEAFRIRNVFAYLTLSVFVAVALTIYAIGLGSAGDMFNLLVSVLTGVVAGFIYWWIAGRTAGEWRANPRTVPNAVPTKSDIPAA